MRPKIRQASDDDQIELCKLIFSLFPLAQPTFGEKDAYFIAEDGGQACGFAHLRILSSSIVLQGLGVLPSYRREGLGKALVSHALKWAQERFAHLSVKLKVESSNAPAISIYLKKGFMVGNNCGSALKLVKQNPN